MASPFSFVPRLWANWITLLGAILTTCSGLAIVLFVVIEAASVGFNPYTSLLLVISLPLLFIAGLLLIPVGLWIDRRKRARGGPLAPTSPEGSLLEALRLAMQQKSSQRLLLFFAVATIANVLIFSIGGQRAVHYMDSAKFCGTTCHTVMQPEWTNYVDSKHSRVACVQCHIGPGAAWALKAKINGVKQVWGVVTKSYSRPVPTPVEHLRPSRDTCEQCHWPARFTQQKLVTAPHFLDGKENKPNYNVLLVRVGGKNERTQKYEGIHWHASDTAEVRYEVLDSKRSKIGKITVLEQGKVVSEYLPPEKDRALPVLGQRTMDCIDCHNRPTHNFALSAAEAVDQAMGQGRLDVKTPWLVKVSRTLLETKDVSRDDAEARFRTMLDEAYRTTYADVKPAPESLDQAAKTLAGIYQRNMFPQMNVGFGTYRSRLGHLQEGQKGDEVGCFRCHDGEHVKVSPTGSKVTLSKGCERCHETLAAGEDPKTLEPALAQVLPK